MALTRIVELQEEYDRVKAECEGFTPFTTY